MLSSLLIILSVLVPIRLQALQDFGALGVDAEKTQKWIADVWASLPKTVAISNTTHRIAQDESQTAQRFFTVTVQTHPDDPVFFGPWAVVSRWVHRSLAQGV